MTRNWLFWPHLRDLVKESALSVTDSAKKPSASVDPETVFEHSLDFTSFFKALGLEIAGQKMIISRSASS